MFSTAVHMSSNEVAPSTSHPAISTHTTLGCCKEFRLLHRRQGENQFLLSRVPSRILKPLQLYKDALTTDPIPAICTTATALVNMVE